MDVNTDTLFSLLKSKLSTVSVLTPNRRLAATLHKLYQQHQLEHGQQCWQTPDILPLSSWITRLWNEYNSNQLTTAPLLLSPTQEQFLWEKIVVGMKDSNQLLQISEAATLAKSAWGLLKQWQVNYNDPIFLQTDDSSALHTWCLAFAKYCETQCVMDTTTLLDRVTAKITEKLIKPAAHIVLLGFTEINPQLQLFLEKCSQQGSQVKHINVVQVKRLPTITTMPHEQRISLLDSDSEIQTMARWAKERLAKDQHARIGCVIPALEKTRDRVEQIFSEVFANENTYAIDQQSALFNISAGKSLVQYPIINTALLLLGLHKNKVPLEIFSYLLASPFLGNAENERIKRSLFDHSLRENNIISIDLELVLPLSADKKQLSLANNCPQLAKRLKQFLTLAQEYKSIQTYNEWAALFNQLLSILGWPGERSLNSEEYQVVEAWLKLLVDFTTIDQIANPVNYQQALSTLQKMAASSVFQPQTPEAPIQILGLLEAAALPFDYLWIAGLNDITWPPQPQPNPFIPKRLQRELQMPHATAERELQFCQLMMRQFKASADSIIYSHATKDEKLELQVSPLIRDVSEISLADLNLHPYHSPAERIYVTKEIESLLDNNAPPISSEEIIRGGVRILQQQALCPFKSFAELRLHAHAVENTQVGLRAKDRGTIMHATLETLWNKIQDQAQLLAMADAELKACINDSITTAMTLFFKEGHQSNRYINLEKQRIHRLVLDWLQLEKSRPAFKVLTHEKKVQFTLEHLPLSLQIDRIDELSDGKRLIIDYKTGKTNNINNWFSDRPEEPQLPIYALIDTDNTIGISYAQIYPGAYCFKGISSYSTDINGINVVNKTAQIDNLSWSEQLQQWRITLTALATQFTQGVAIVDPKDPKKTCTYCELKPLCRIYDEVFDTYDE